MAQLLFWILSVAGIASAVGIISNRNPIYCVLFTVANFFCIAGLYLTLHAEFLAAVQIIVYAGAIMVLFLFVVMLLNLGNETPEQTGFDWRKGLAFILGLGFFIELVVVFSRLENISEPLTFEFGKVEPIGIALMGDYLFPFEMISVILLAALMGAVIIAKKHN